MTIEVMKQALEALETCMYPQQKQIQAITSLRQAIEQAEKQEPVALETVYETIIQWDEGGGKRSRRELARRIMALYIPQQPQREWVGLMRGVRVDGDTVVITVKGGNESARQLCAELLKEKNT